MSLGEFPYVQTGTHFMACAPLSEQPLGIVGVPFDGAVTNRSGARMGPNAIRLASLMLCDGEHPVFGVSPLSYLGDGGDLRLPNASGLTDVRDQIQAQALPLLKKHQMVFLGGDHSVTLSLLRAAVQVHGRVALVHCDAHCDTWTDHFGEPSGHGTWVYEALEEGLVEPTQCVQIGLRSSGQRAAREYVQDQGGLIFTARQLRGLDGEGLQSVVDDIVDRLGDTPVYLSVDIDCLDPAFAPGTGTPEPGGLATTQLLTLIEELAPLNWVAMDCVEVSPAYDHAELTSNAAAHLVWTYLSARAQLLLES
jgi:agmatinase